MKENSEHSLFDENLGYNTMSIGKTSAGKTFLLSKLFSDIGFLKPITDASRTESTGRTKLSTEGGV